MSNKRTKPTTQEDYIFEDAIPNIPEINLAELRDIEEKLKDYVLGKSKDGISMKEAQNFLDWVSFNARNYVVDKTNESILAASMAGQCALTQDINYEIFKKIGLDIRAFNMSNTIGDIPMRKEDKEYVTFLYGKNIGVRHAVALVNIPIIDNKNNTKLYKFQLDPTFRQFCLKENCNIDIFSDEEREFVSPDPGYFMMQDTLTKLGVEPELAQKSENLAKEIIRNGYFLLNEESAKLYGDAFVRASERLEFQNTKINMTGLDYIKNFENNPSLIIKMVDEEYKKLPSEIKEPKPNVFSRIINYIKNRFQSNKKPIALPLYEPKTENLQSAKLTEEQLKDFRNGEKNVLEHCNESNHNLENKDVKEL